MRLLLFNLAIDLDDPILGFTSRWIRALASRVESIHVITMRRGRVELPDNVQVFSMGKERGYSEPHRAVQFYRHLLRIAREVPITMCFSHMTPIFTVLAAPVLKAMRIPVITWYAHRQVTWVLKLAHHFSDSVVSADKTSYQYRHDKFASLGHGIDTSFFALGDTPLDSPPLLLSVGRLSPIKDLFTLVEAIHLLRQRGQIIRCSLVGEAPARDLAYAVRVRRLTSDLGLDGIVQFAGGVPNDQVVHWYHRCFAHVNCSAADNALDKAPLEAMACGRLSLSSTLGFRQTMGSRADSLLFQHGNPVDLADKLTALLARPPAEVKQIGLELRQRVLQMHTLDRLIDKLVDRFVELRQRHTKV